MLPPKYLVPKKRKKGNSKATFSKTILIIIWTKRKLSTKENFRNLQSYRGSRGSNVERAGETAKGKLWQSKEKSLWPLQLRISLPCSYQVQILNVFDWLRPWLVKPVWYREPIKSDVHGQSQSETRFKIWTWYEHGSEILNGRGQRLFSSLQSFPFAVSPALSVLGPLEPG